MSTPTTDPAAWTDLVEHHTRRLIAEGVDPADARPQAQLFVDDHMREEAYRTDQQIGPRHHRDPDADRVACGQLAGTIGASAYARAVAHICCADCREEIDRRVTSGADVPYGLGPSEISAARQRYAERYMAGALGVPDWALPSATEGTPLHSLAVQVRRMTALRARMAGRLEQALKTQQGKTERARDAIAAGGLPSWDLLEPDPAVETAATAEGLRMLDKVLGEMAGVLVMTCTQTDRWLKAEGVTGEPDGELRVIAAACDWRDLRKLSVTGAPVHMDSVTALVDAVDAYRRGLRPVLDSPPVDPGPRCTHGGDCPVHPDVRGLHNVDPTAADALREVLDAAMAGPLGAAEVLRIADRLRVDVPGFARRAADR